MYSGKPAFLFPVWVSVFRMGYGRAQHHISAEGDRFCCSFHESFIARKETIGRVI